MTTLHLSQDDLCHYTKSNYLCLLIQFNSLFHYVHVQPHKSHKIPKIYIYKMIIWKRSNKANIRKHIMSHEDETNCPVEFCLFIKKMPKWWSCPFERNTWSPVAFSAFPLSFQLLWDTRDEAKASTIHYWRNKSQSTGQSRADQLKLAPT